MDRQLVRMEFLEKFFPVLPSPNCKSEEEYKKNIKDKKRMLERTMKKILCKLLSSNNQFNQLKTTAMKSEEKKKIELKPYTLSQLASIYQVDRKTFRKWINPFGELIGTRIGNLYSIPQVKIIFSKLSFPSSFIIYDEEEDRQL